MTELTQHGPERLRAYHLANAVSVEAGRLVPRVRCTVARADQLVRSADSVAFNIAEGAMHTSAAQKARYYRIARASAGECGAVLARIAADNPTAAIEPLQRRLRMLSKMLLALIRSQEPRPL